MILENIDLNIGKWKKKVFKVTHKKGKLNPYIYTVSFFNISYCFLFNVYLFILERLHCMYLCRQGGVEGGGINRLSSEPDVGLIPTTLRSEP